MEYVNINGKLKEAGEACLHYDNRAFRYGYGLFETMLVQNEIIALEAYHWSRLFDGMEQLCFNVPRHFTPLHLQEEVLRTVKKNRLEKRCRVRLQVFAGPGGMFETEHQIPEFLIECFPLSDNVIALNENGLVVGVAQNLAKTADSLSPLKSCSALIYAMAAQQAHRNKWNDALICNTAGKIIESTIANVFWVKNETVYTPPVEEGCIAGVMRRHLIKSMMEQAVPFEEKILAPQDLLFADEIFLTNAIRRIKWIGMIGDKQYESKLIRQLDRWVIGR